MAEETSTVRVRRYRREDAPFISQMGHSRRWPADALRSEGQAWVVLQQGNVKGFATASPLPGLQGVVGLDGFIAASARRQGLGTVLLRKVLRDLRHDDVRRVTHPVSTTQSVAARFLQAHQFFVEHEEWELTLSLPDTVSAPDVPAGCHIKAFPFSRAVDLFCALYEESFGGEAWYQPYSRDEVSTELEDAGNLLFLVCGEEAVGFVWVRIEEKGTGRIEPLGVVRQHQGRGLGRVLLDAALHRLCRKGARRVCLGLWRGNQRALELYRRAGFRRTSRRLYLARDLVDEQVAS